MQGAAAIRPHAVQSTDGTGTSTCDDNGNLLTGAVRSISWTPGKATPKVLQTTMQGAERFAGAGATRGGVSSAESAQVVLHNGRILAQADGAVVHVMQNTQGRFSVVVSGERGIITTFETISDKSFDRLSKN